MATDCNHHILPSLNEEILTYEFLRSADIHANQFLTSFYTCQLHEVHCVLAYQLPLLIHIFLGNAQFSQQTYLPETRERAYMIFQ